MGKRLSGIVRRSPDTPPASLLTAPEGWRKLNSSGAEASKGKGIQLEFAALFTTLTFLHRKDHGYFTKGLARRPQGRSHRLEELGLGKDRLPLMSYKLAGSYCPRGGKASTAHRLIGDQYQGVVAAGSFAATKPRVRAALKRC